MTITEVYTPNVTKIYPTCTFRVVSTSQLEGNTENSFMISTKYKKKPENKKYKNM